MQKKQGISLIVLVITIIVMIILAASVVITLSNTGVMDKAVDSVDKTTLGELRYHASLIWSEEFLSGKRGNELKISVLDKLKDYTEKYDIEVTDKGVEVSNKKDSCFPIIWNTLQESDTIVNLNGMTLMKISDATPMEEEFDNVYATFEDIVYSGQVIQAGQTIPFDYKEQHGNLTIYSNQNITAFACFVVYEAGMIEDMGVTFPETGIYVMSFKNDGLESNVKVNVLLPKLEKPVITLLNNTLTINSVEHATGYEIYIDDELKSTVTNLTVDLTENISSLSDYFVSVRAISTDNYDPSKVASVWISNSEEEPGMYDDSGNKICSLPELVIDYNWGINSFLTVHNYDTNMAGLCYILKNTPEFKDVTKLVFDFETTIQSGLFMGCSQLKEIILPEDLTGIGSFAFEECLNLTSINIPNKVTDISIGIFGGCDNLTSISVEPGNAVYYSIDNCIIKSENKTLVLGCKNSIIPSDGTVTIIGNSAFDGCNGLIEVIIPAEITKIGNSSFTECVGLKKVGFETGSKLTNIDAGAFSDCVNLEEFNFPASLRKISGGAFRNDKKLVRAIFEEPATWYHTNDLVASTQYANGSVTPTQCADPAFMANKLLTVSCYQWFRN